MVRPRVAVAGFQHESNSFSPFDTDWREFEKADGWPPLTTGPALIDTFRPLNIPLGGFIDADEIEAVPLAWASAEPAGPVTDDAFDRMSALLCDGLKAAGRLDGVFLDLHGAMVVASHEDGEGELLRRIRAVTGPNLPIVVSLDMHANITPLMVELSDAIAIYRTYPHIDMRDTGARCRALMLARIARRRPFAKAFRKLPYLIPLAAQFTGAEPFRSLYGSLGGRTSPAVLSIDLGAGFPPADIYECGPAIVAYGLDQTSTDAAADALHADALAAEGRFDSALLSIGDAVARAMAEGAPGTPVILADVQDNPGCGATSDTTSLLRALIEAGAQNVALGLLCDPEIADRAHEAGIGARIEGQIGGRYGYDPAPLRGAFLVEALSDGIIEGTGLMFRGSIMSLGPMARLKVLDTQADIRVVVCSIRFQCLDQALLRSLGVDPQACSILVIKSTVHFRADFDPVARAVLSVEAPGANVCRAATIPYRRLRPGVRLGVGDRTHTFQPNTPAEAITS